MEKELITYFVWDYEYLPIYHDSSIIIQCYKILKPSPTLWKILLKEWRIRLIVSWWNQDKMLGLNRGPFLHLEHSQMIFYPSTRKRPLFSFQWWDTMIYPIKNLVTFIEAHKGIKQYEAYLHLYCVSQLHDKGIFIKSLPSKLSYSALVHNFQPSLCVRETWLPISLHQFGWSIQSTMFRKPNVSDLIPSQNINVWDLYLRLILPRYP